MSLATMALICQSRGLGFETIHCRHKTGYFIQPMLSVLFKKIIACLQAGLYAG